MAQQVLTLLAGVIGAVLGLLAPVVTASLGRRTRDHDSQREIAGQILQLFDSADTLTAALTGAENLTRRKLYLLALRLQHDGTRNACLTVVAVAGQGPDAREQLEDAWYEMTNALGQVYRRRRIGA